MRLKIFAGKQTLDLEELGKQLPEGGGSGTYRTPVDVLSRRFEND